MANQYELAELLKEISLYETAFRKRAFLNASSIILSLDKEEFDDLISNPTANKLKSIHGIGSSVASCILDYINTGKISRLEDHVRNGDVKGMSFF